MRKRRRRPPEEQRIVNASRQAYQVTTFAAEIARRQEAGIPYPNVGVETGTYLGEMTTKLLPMFDVVHTVELSIEMYVEAKQRIGAWPGIIMHLGDSTQVVQRLASKLREPVLWYLDAHHVNEGSNDTGMETAHNDVPPVLDELKVIAGRNQPDIIYLDDYHRFGEWFKEVGGYNAYVTELFGDRIAKKMRTPLPGLFVSMN
jgi:hypothetical protein